MTDAALIAMYGWHAIKNSQFFGAETVSADDIEV